MPVGLFPHSIKKITQLLSFKAHTHESRILSLFENHARRYFLKS